MLLDLVVKGDWGIWYLGFWIVLSTRVFSCKIFFRCTGGSGTLFRRFFVFCVRGGDDEIGRNSQPRRSVKRIDTMELELLADRAHVIGGTVM